MSYKIIKDLDKVIFRAYDIRGIVGVNLNADVVYTIALAIGSNIVASNNKSVVIGRDGRLSSDELGEALRQGLLDSGCDITDIGMVPSPLVNFAIATLGIPSGVMLTGSHNPKDYNGLKITIAGETLSEQKIENIFNTIKEIDFKIVTGSYRKYEILDNYITDIKNRLQIPRPLKVVVDCGNGIGSVVAPDLFEALGCEVIKLYCDIDGNFPNHHPNPSVAENMLDLQRAVKENSADLGVAFDGDADRIGLVTEAGEIIWPDRQMMLFAKDILQRQAGAKIVFDVKCSNFLADVITKFSGEPILWKTGHSLIKAKMINEKAALGGEMSGHIFFNENWYGFDDGVYVAARIVEILAKQNDTLTDIFNEFPDGYNTPELLISIAEEKKFTFVEKLKQSIIAVDGEVNLIDGVRVNFPYGWFLVRASNTTPCLTLRLEADSKVNLEKICRRVSKQLQDISPELDLTLLEC